MDPKEIQHLREVARLYGAPSTSAFAREMFSAMLSPDAALRMSWAESLSRKLGEQLSLNLSEREVAPAAAVPAKRARKVRRRRGRRKGASDGPA